MVGDQRCCCSEEQDRADTGLLSAWHGTWRLWGGRESTSTIAASVFCARASKSVLRKGWRRSFHTLLLCARAAAASRGALSVEIPLSEHVQLLRNRTSEAVGRTSSYSLVLAWTQWGLGACADCELPCCFLGQPLNNISGYGCDNRCRKLWFERSLPSDILFVSFIREGSNSIARGP